MSDPLTPEEERDLRLTMDRAATDHVFEFGPDADDHINDLLATLDAERATTATLRDYAKSMHYGPTRDPWQRGWNAAIDAILYRAALAADGAAWETERPTIDCLCGDIFPTVETFHEHLHLSHPEADHD